MQQRLRMGAYSDGSVFLERGDTRIEIDLKDVSPLGDFLFATRVQGDRHRASALRVGLFMNGEWSIGRDGECIEGSSDERVELESFLRRFAGTGHLGAVRA